MLRAITDSAETLRQIGDDVLADAVAEIFLLGVAAHVDERQDADRHARRARLRAAAACRLGVRAEQARDAACELAPAGRVGVAVPVR